VMILLHLRTRSNILLLSASPTMLQHYRESKEDIQRAHLPGGLLQDALVIANFPLKNPWLHIEEWREGHL